jgi:hypothetical protein
MEPVLINRPNVSNPPLTVRKVLEFLKLHEGRIERPIVYQHPCVLLPASTESHPALNYVLIRAHLLREQHRHRHTRPTLPELNASRNHGLTPGWQAHWIAEFHFQALLPDNPGLRVMVC